MNWAPGLSRPGHDYQPVPKEPDNASVLEEGDANVDGCKSKSIQFYSSADMQRPFVCGVGFEVRTVSKVDCVAEEFFSDVSIFFKWFDEANTGFAVGVVEASQLANQPDVMIANDITAEERSKRFSKLASDPPGVVQCEAVYTGVFRQFMELENFPLDSQDLTVSLRFVDCRWTVRSLESPRFNRVTSGVELAEWYMYEPRTQTGRDDVGNPTWDLKMSIFRKSRYYVTNILGLMGGITSLVFFAFLFQPTSWGARSAYCATLLLTSVAFKLVVDGALPKVSFTTILDLYMMTAFVMMVGVVVEAASVKLLELMFHLSPRYLVIVDRVLAGLMVSGWLIWNIAYLCRFFHFEKQRLRSLGELAHEVNTNKPTKPRCRSFMCCHDDSDSDLEEADSDEDEYPVDGQDIRQLQLPSFKDRQGQLKPPAEVQSSATARSPKLALPATSYQLQLKLAA